VNEVAGEVHLSFEAPIGKVQRVWKKILVPREKGKSSSQVRLGPYQDKFLVRTISRKRAEERGGVS